MKGESVSYGNVTVYPEYCDLTTDDLLLASKEDMSYHIAAKVSGRENRVFVYHDDWLEHARSKYRLHSSEIEEGLTRGTVRPKAVKLGGVSVLILICYELLFSQDYLLQNINKTDLVVHLVGQPMFSEVQREGWVAMHEVLSCLYRCPVVCCCGGSVGRMNISGVTLIESKMKKEVQKCVQL